MDIDHFSPELIARARGIKLLVLDVDGVLSDGKLYMGNDTEPFKAFNSLDGHGIKMLIASKVNVAIITGRTSHIVTRRAADLGISHVIQGREDKLSALTELEAAFDLKYPDIAFMGDDYPDLPVIRRVGLGITPANGHWIVKQHAHWQSQYTGGNGAVREACDLLMLAQGTFDTALAPYL